MSQHAFGHGPTAPDSQDDPDPRRKLPGAGEDHDVDTEAALSLLSDEHARSIVRTLAGDRLPARAVVDQVEASRATVYRRLKRMEEAGLVESSIAYDPDGHHRKEFAPAVDSLTVAVEEDGLSVAPAD